MTTPPQPAQGNPYAQPTGGNPYVQPTGGNPYAQVPAQGNPYPPQPQYQQQPQFQAPPQQYPAPQPQFQQQYQDPQGGLHCRFCGAQPAVDGTVHAHRGMLLRMQRRWQKGPFCRTCGIASVRQLSSDTLLQGWWGVQSFFLTPVSLLQNLFTYRKFKALPQPVPGQPGQQLALGRPLLQRPGVIGLLVPVAVVALVIYGFVASSSDPQYAKVGDCVQNQGSFSDPDVSVTACAPGTYKVIAKLSNTTSDSGCPQATTTSYFQEESGDDFVLCLVQDGS